MKVDFYTYNSQIKQYNYPTFMAKPIKINWKGDSGKLIEKSLMAMASAAAITTLPLPIAENAEMITTDKNGNVITKPLDKSDLLETPESIFQDSKACLEELYKKTKDPDILEKHAQLYKDAYKNRELLKGGYSDLTDSEIDETIIETYTIDALSIMGKGTLEAAFGLDLVGFRNLCVDIACMKYDISRHNLELLKKKIYPSGTTEYKNLEENVRKDKRKINSLLGKENSLKRKELLEQIEALKGNKSNIKEIKELKKQIQDLYKNCENSSEIAYLIKEINELQRKKKELISQKVNLSPQEIINKVWTIAATSQNDFYKSGDDFDLTSSEEGMALYCEIMEKYKGLDEDTILNDEDIELLNEFRSIDKRKLNKDIKELIELIQPSTPENENLWNKTIEKRLYERAGYNYTEEHAKYLDLAHCKYLNKLFASDDDFWNVFPSLLGSINIYNVNGDMSLDHSFDVMEHNVQTREMYEDLGIDYINWTRYYPNSFVSGTATIKEDDVKNKAVKNMCYDLASLYKTKKIPQKEKSRIFKALKEIGVSVNRNGNKADIKINGREVQYSDLASIMSIIKREFNANTFWSEEHENENIDDARDMVYHHFMLQRKQEIDIAKKIKNEENIDVKVQKVNMNDIKYALCLGNHSHCCTALGSQSNEWTAPLYVLSKCISAIEVLANGEPVGNTMIYMAKVNGELSLVLDDIELQAKFQNNDKIKDMIIKYAQQLCEEVGKPNIHIYAGPGLHKVDMTEYKYIEDATMEIIGKTPENGGVYLDFDGEQHDIGNIVEKTDLYQII